MAEVIQRRSLTSGAQWTPAGVTIREFGAKSHSRAETGSHLRQPHAEASEFEASPGIIHVLNGKALTAKGRLLLERANENLRSFRS